MSDSTPLDDALLDELGVLVRRADPPPGALLGAARRGFALRRPGAVVAGLAYDSAVDSDLAMVRGEGSAGRLLTFEVGEVAIELEATAAGAARQVVGQVIPPQVTEIVVDHAGGLAAATTDALGRFTLAGLAPGPIRLRCRLTVGQRAEDVVTQWVTA